MIPINERFSLDSDRHNVILVEHVPSKNKNGEDVVTDNKLFFPNHKRALNMLIRKEVLDCDNLAQIVNRIDKVEEKILVALKNMEEGN